VFSETRDVANAPAEDYTTVPTYPAKPVPSGGEPRTGVPRDVLKRIADAYVSPPPGFTVHPKVLPQLQRRSAMLGKGGVDWGTAEIVAFGSLLMEGRPVRLAGQDSRRGTFVQRFATVVCRYTGDEWSPLQHLDPAQGPFHVYDSLLSEFAALGFEYGYSVARPDALVLWEAQFGDFVNGAQTIIDEFISSGEAKWGQHSGLVLLLPHGYEGQGPDHSSARIERFLALASEGAIRVAQPSLPANHFHLLRSQALQAEHRPLVVFAPKSMLRHKAAVSELDDFLEGTAFRPVVGDSASGGVAVDPDAVRRVLLCSGKVAWDLTAERTKRQDAATAIVRVEQLYPLPVDELRAELERFPNASVVRWVQDEPANQGPWPFMGLALPERVLDDVPLSLVARPESSAPAVGSHARHLSELRSLLEQAFA
jgi:2-oxoglutarate dehydrogenase E1 component